ncbi:hypothetical protein EI42_02398 [Thermosporothrix hazakensis]|uniref:Uncharacterized protein n=1 Tax=Thermosporothrix hazakensis TaxID=644383 RepID=A0A326UHY8_THEHA|nr:hypothetical protein [Thermosporothrix hazakensis]PZW31301.1 hypothetical protein EI42_02398 [Thermosporothrix hazakensis]GCE50787.1 hypothetical protein KTH_56560 [Thermosporothrix hazakensis]
MSTNQPNSRPSSTTSPQATSAPSPTAHINSTRDPGGCLIALLVFLMIGHILISLVDILNPVAFPNDIPYPIIAPAVRLMAVAGCIGVLKLRKWGAYLVFVAYAIGGVLSVLDIVRAATPEVASAAVGTTILGLILPAILIGLIISRWRYLE